MMSSVVVSVSLEEETSWEWRREPLCGATGDPLASDNAVEALGDTGARCDRGDADDTEGVTGEGNTRSGPADRAVKDTVGVRIGGRTGAADPSPEADPEADATEAEDGTGAEANAEPIVERDAAPSEF